MLRVLPLIYTEKNDFIVIDKPTGWNTHAVDYNKPGVVELYSHQLGRELKVVHRLDKTTSGTLVFAKTAEAAAALSALFESHQVEKKYAFLTDRKLAFKPEGLLKVESYIEKQKNQFVSLDNQKPNAETHFEFQSSLGPYDLWWAYPKTGKPHQIRLHAQKLGIPVLGDLEHGGSPSHRVFLHSLSLNFKLAGENYFFETKQPAWSFEASPVVAALQEAAENRRRLFNFHSVPSESLRLSHREVDSVRMDQYGPHWWFYWYKENLPSTQELSDIKSWADKANKKFAIRLMLDRGDDPNTDTLLTDTDTPVRWQATENGLTYELRSDSGLSPGLFLDQRENRIWVAEQAFEKRVLNLFSYTGGFSVVAAKNGATEVCTVDVSQNFIDWSKRNFELNGLDIANEKYEFWNNDVMLFLKGCYRRKRKFNLIVCDPPSFGRSKNGLFSISKNFEELMTHLLYCTEKNGLILFSTNYEKWTTGDLHLKMNQLKKEFSIKVLPAPVGGPDFESPDQEPLMKSILIRKN